MSRSEKETAREIMDAIGTLFARFEKLEARVEAALPRFTPKIHVEIPAGFNTAEMLDILRNSKCPYKLSDHTASQPANFGGYSEQRLAALGTPTGELLADNGYVGLRSAVDGVEYRSLRDQFTSGTDPAENVEPVSGMSTLFTQTGRIRDEDREMNKAIRLGLGYRAGRYDKDRAPVDIYKATAEQMLAQSRPSALHKSWIESTGTEPEGLTEDSMVDFRLSNGNEVLNQRYGATKMGTIWPTKGGRRNTCTHWRFSAAAPREQLTVPGGLEWEEPWTENTGRMPVLPNTLVFRKFRDGRVSVVAKRAQACDWAFGGKSEGEEITHWRRAI